MLPRSLLLAAIALLGLVSSAQAADDGVQHLYYKIGPIQVTPGQNRIAYRPILANEKPDVNGWIVGFRPNLVRADGSVPRTDHVMFHHGVWLNLSRDDSTVPYIPERMFAVGEEKTHIQFPPGFGYRYLANDDWLLNHMVHNLTSEPMTLYVSYELDFIPDSSPAAQGMRPVRPIWMDVENGSGYPVFDVYKGSGGADGKFTYPDDADNPYPNGIQRNLWQVDRNGVLVSTAGHVHTGGLNTDLYLRRTNAHYLGRDCSKLATAKQRRRCRNRSPSVSGNRVHLFRSDAKYWEPAGPVSWDVSMKGTRPNWLVSVHKGDILEVDATYETRLASWYESMGIMIAYMADGGGGKDPYRTKVDWPGQVTHGHLSENSVHGGGPSDLPDPRRLPSGIFDTQPLTISGFTYQQGDLRLSTPNNRPPVVKEGKSLTFELSQQDSSQEIWHSLTSCAPPCNKSTGIAYPIADGKFQFDSGQLGTQTPAVHRTTWETPKTLPTGTYTYFCRIHPLMRGSFRVIK